ncbi:leucine-rich repeat-containing protein 37A3-like isoform X1 [Catharus ustulatus]|uniref:leucine-rich repeat-containing protein 37A3-like isoform X1 n=1 Tax=Catharus ustulatus TaxID=91951 RepID=UPI00140D4120|nr:leucine-rich repeat-containing protein 37A3-like isoform X1 [Catharus ustulatus]
MLLAPSSRRTGPIPLCDLLFPQKPLWEWPHADPQRHFPGLARDAVSPGGVSGPRAKERHGRASLCRLSAGSVGKSSCALWKALTVPVDVSQGAAGACSWKGPFPCPAHLLHGFLDTGQAIATCPAHPAPVPAISPDRALLFLRILSHNPLAVIADAAFFKLPSVMSLDLSATQVTPQTLLLLLQTTLSLETLQVPREVACCLCKESPFTESPCRSILFPCKKLCSTSAPQCAQRSLVQTRGETLDMEQPRTLSTSPMLNLKPKEPSLGDDRTATLVIALTPSAEDDVSSLDNSRSNSYPPQHLLENTGIPSVDDVRTQLKKKLHMKKLHTSKSIQTAKSLLPYQRQPPRLKDVLEKTPSSWDQQEMQSHLNRHRLNPSDVGGGLHRAYGASVTGQRRDEEEDPAPRRNYIRRHKRHKRDDSRNWVGHKQLLYQVWRSGVKVEPKPRADQGLKRNLDFLSDPSVQSRPAASSWGEALAEEEQSSLGRHPLISPDTTEEKGSVPLNKPWSPRSPDVALVPGELLETALDLHQQLLEADKGLQTFMAHVERTLKMDCSLPQLKQACAKMVSKTRLLVNVLRERQENQEASDAMDQCPQQENMIIHMALGKGKKLPRKNLEVVVYVIISVALLFFFIFVYLIVKCVFQKRSRPREPDCQRCHSRTLCLRRFCVNLPQRERKDNQEAQDVEQNWAGSSSESCPCTDSVHGASQLKKSELSWIQRIRRVYESER